MRKIVFAAIGIIGCFVVGTAVLDHAWTTGPAELDGGRADGRTARQNLLAMVDTGHTGRPLLVAMQIH